MRKIRCSVSYHDIKVAEFENFAEGVKENIYANPMLFPMPPIDIMMFQGQIGDYATKRANYTLGGSAQKGPYLAAKQLLMDTLDSTALYVDTVALGDPNVITTAGYVPTKGSRTEVLKPTQLTAIQLLRGSTGTLFAECEAQAGVDSYLCILTKDVTLPPEVVVTGTGQLVYQAPTEANGAAATAPTIDMQKTIIDLTKGRKKTFLNLQPGSMYYFVFVGINTGGVGPLSVPVGINCW